MPETTNWQLEEHQFWHFSLVLYAEPGVMENCLFLQDEYQFNVNIILFCCFSQHLALPLNSAFLTALQQAAQRTEQAISSHRQQRKQYKQKSGINRGEMFDPEHYQLLKQQELTLEKQQQSDLIAAALTHQAQIPLQTQHESENDHTNSDTSGLALYAGLFSNKHPQSLTQAELPSQISEAISAIQFANQSINAHSNHFKHYAATK